MELSKQKLSRLFIILEIFMRTRRLPKSNKKMLKPKLTTFLLCLGLLGYTDATEEAYGRASSLGRKPIEIEFPFLDYYRSTGKLAWSDYYKNRLLIGYTKLCKLVEGRLWPDPLADTNIGGRMLSAALSYSISVSLAEAFKEELQQLDSAAFNEDRCEMPFLTNRIILQHFKHRKLPWMTYGLVLIDFYQKNRYLYSSSRTGWERDWGTTIFAFLLYPICWFSAGSLLNYLFRGKVETMIPHLPWGRVGIIPCFHLNNSGSPNRLDCYINYLEKTFLIGLIVHKDNRSLFGKTDTLFSYRGHTLDMEAGIDLKSITFNRRAPKSPQWNFLLGVQGKFRLGERWAWNVAVSYKTKDFIEGIAAAGNGWVFSTGVTVYI